MALLVAVLVVIVLLLVLQKPVRAYRKFRNLELSIPGPPTLPILGNALDFLNVNEHTVMSTLVRVWGYRFEPSRMSFLGRLVMFVSDAESFEQVAKRRDLKVKPRLLYEFMEDLLGRRGLITLNGTVWKSHRRALQPAFHQDVLDGYMDIFVEEAQLLVQRLLPEQDLYEDLRVAASRAFVRTTLTADMDKENESNMPLFSKFVEKTFRAFNRRSFSLLLWPDVVFNRTQQARSLVTLTEKVEAVVRKITFAKHNKAAEDDSCKTRRRTLIEVIFDTKSKNSDGRPFVMSDEDIMDEVKTFLAAAVETTTSALGWTFKVLSLRPNIQERVHAEIVEQLAGKAALTTADINKLNYLEQVIKETMRVLPPVLGVVRNVPEDTEFAGYSLPANAAILLNIYGCHRNPKHWPDPTRFDPDRFSPEECAKRHPYAFVPFSFGSRNCIGGRYAMMNMKTVVATVLSHFRIDPFPDGHTEPIDLPYTFDVASRMIGGLWVRLTPRATCA